MFLAATLKPPIVLLTKQIEVFSSLLEAKERVCADPVQNVYNRLRLGRGLRDAHDAESSIPVESGNAAIRTGSLGATITKILDELKPEAAYFAEDNGQRTGFIFFDMKDASQLPAIAEPWFLAFNASLTVRPAMNQQDLAASSGGMERAVKGYGKAAA